MRRSESFVLRAVLWVVSLSHIAFGAVVIFPLGWHDDLGRFYGADVDWTPQLTYVVRPLGAFVLVFGALGIAAAVNPRRYRLIGYGIVGVLLMRVALRLVFMKDIESAFGIEPVRNVGSAVFLLLLAVVLLVLLRRAVVTRD